MRRVPIRLIATGAALALALAACGGGGGGGDKTGAGNKTVTLPTCDVKALDNASGTVNITMWHSMTRALLDTLTKLTNQFNASQKKVHVTLVNQTTYTDTLTKFTAGLSNKQLPDIVQAEDVALQQMIDTQAVLPAQSCINAEKYDTSDYVQRMIKYFSVNNVLYPMPFNTSNLVLYYNKNAFKAAGLDPNKPPATLDDVKADSQQLVSKKVVPYGIALKSDSWFLEQGLSKLNEPFANNGNGREKRATAVTFGSPSGVGLFQWLSDMTKAHLLLPTGSNPTQIDDYLAVANQRAGMTIETSAALGTISQLLGAGQFKDVALGVGPLPGSDKGGVLVGGGALYMVKASSPEKQAAAWEYLKFLNSPQSQSTWGAGTGYIPTRQSAVTMEPLASQYKTHPEYKVAYTQLNSGVLTNATAGPVIGPYGSKSVGVRGAVIDAMDAIMLQHADPKTEMPKAVQKANAAITQYNQRIGAG